MAHPPPRHRYLPSVVLLAALGLGGPLLAVCSTPPGAGQAETSSSETSPTKAVEVGRPVEVVEALLRDKTTTGQDGRTSWTTTWRVCFAANRADMTRLEALAVTTEGTGTSLRELEGKCLELDVARGQGKADAGIPGRKAQLAEAGALAYRVRAVHDDGTVTPWTEPIHAGTTKAR